jgi:hypothetical protein
MRLDAAPDIKILLDGPLVLASPSRFIFIAEGLEKLMSRLQFNNEARPRRNFSHGD